MNGKFITVEGIEGAGKSCNLDFIESLLKQQNFQVVRTREPGGTLLGEHLREILLGFEFEAISIDTELMLMFASRAQHLHEVIIPALTAGKWVLCDRFTDASYAYQGGGRGIETKKIEQLENFVLNKLRPDLTIVLDLPVAVGMERAGKRSALDRIESEEHDFFEAVRQTYLRRVEQYGERMKAIDAERPLVDVQAQIALVMKHFLAQI